MSKKYKKFLWISLVCFIALGLIINSFVVAYDKNKEIPQADKDKLYAQEQLVSEDFANITKFDNAEIEIKDRKAIVTFTENECKLEAVYDEDLELVSSAVIHNKLTTDKERLSYSYVAAFVIPTLVWLLMFLLVELRRIYNA